MNTDLPCRFIFERSAGKWLVPPGAKFSPAGLWRRDRLKPFEAGYLTPDTRWGYGHARRYRAQLSWQAVQSNILAISAFCCGIAAGCLSADEMDLNEDAAEQAMRNCGWGSLLEDGT